MTLSDVARCIAPDVLINRIVFDLDQLVGVANEAVDGATPPSCRRGGDNTVCTPGMEHSCRGGGMERESLSFEARFESGNLRKAIQVLQMGGTTQNGWAGPDRMGGWDHTGWVGGARDTLSENPCQCQFWRNLSLMPPETASLQLGICVADTCSNTPPPIEAADYSSSHPKS